MKLTFSAMIFYRPICSLNPLGMIFPVFVTLQRVKLLFLFYIGTKTAETCKCAFPFVSLRPCLMSLCLQDAVNVLLI